jgi:transposase
MADLSYPIPSESAGVVKTMNGARVGDLFMSLIHTCELNKVNPFDYLTELLRHPAELAVRAADWMPWSYKPIPATVAA